MAVNKNQLSLKVLLLFLGPITLSPRMPERVVRTLLGTVSRWMLKKGHL